jgi:hypothetical protein
MSGPRGPPDKFGRCRFITYLSPKSRIAAYQAIVLILRGGCPLSIGPPQSAYGPLQGSFAFSLDLDRQEPGIDLADRL